MALKVCGEGVVDTLKISKDACKRVKGAHNPTTAEPVASQLPALVSMMTLETNGHPLDNDYAARIIVIGGASGDFVALQAVLTGLVRAPVAIVAAVELRQDCAEPIINSLQEATGYSVRLAQSGVSVLAGQVLLLPNGCTLTFRGSRGSVSCLLNDFTSACDHRHTIDILFASAAEVLGSRAMGILLSGTGPQGSHGLLTMQQFHCLTAREIGTQTSSARPKVTAGKRVCEAEQVPLAGMGRWILEAVAERPLPPPEQSYSKRLMQRA